MKSDLPPFNDYSSETLDIAGGKFYLFGGCRQASIVTTSDFYCYNAGTRDWLNLTHKLRFLTSHIAPHGEGPIRPLPPLMNASMGVIYFNNKTYILIFGGRNLSKAHAPPCFTSDLIVIDTDQRNWWIAPFVDGVITPRMGAGFTCIDNRVYVFGGVAQQHGGGLGTIYSFSIAEHCMGQWRWVVKDRPYPSFMTGLGWSCRTLPVHGNQMILLTAGRSEDDRIRLRAGQLALFDPKTHQFQVQNDIIGNFPHGIAWYYLHAFPSDAFKRYAHRSQQSISLSASASPRDSVEAPLSSWFSSSASVRSTQTTFTRSAALLFAMLPHERYLTPELYAYLLQPVPEVRCLHLRDIIWNLELDLEMCAVVNGRLLIFGRDDDNRGKKAFWNTCVEVDLADLA